MAVITLGQIIDAIESTLSSAAERSQSFDELTEGIHNDDTPLLQVYWESTDQVSQGATNTDRMTLGGGSAKPVRRKLYTIFADYYATRRGHLNEDMKKLVDGYHDMETILENEDKCPHFGLEGIKEFSWTARRVVFEYGDVNFIGMRFEIRVFVY